jgi:DNA-binding NarL/FixJ family response regulator
VDDGGASLTPSEQRVARMAVAGMSNRDIATELGVGERTVEVHLTRTYRKLGVKNRRGLGAAELPPYPLGSSGHQG